MHSETGLILWDLGLSWLSLAWLASQNSTSAAALRARHLGIMEYEYCYGFSTEASVAEVYVAWSLVPNCGHRSIATDR